jgi:malonyl-CoA/methylmalonyl-CoA synthetase
VDYTRLPSATYDGQLRIKGPTVFQEYFNNREATRKEFDNDGYFMTGDIAMYDASKDSYAILGRSSVDIIKSGGCVWEEGEGIVGINFCS